MGSKKKELVDLENERLRRTGKVSQETRETYEPVLRMLRRVRDKNRR